ncbi:MAG: SMP-30/gluconolactonase/LRE family protein [Bacteroidota bacterium]
MRLLVPLLALALSTVASAQTVRTVTFPDAASMDGLYYDAELGLMTVGGYVGTNVYDVQVGPEAEGGLPGARVVVGTGLDGPVHVTRSPDGNLYATNFAVANATESTVSRITPEGVVTPFATVPPGAADLVADADGNLYVTSFGYIRDGSGNAVSKITPDGTVTEYARGGTISIPVGVALDEAGDLYVANIYSGHITKVAPDGSTSLFADLPAANFEAGEPFAIGHLVWSQGRLYATQTNRNRVVAFDPDGTMTVVAGSGARSSVDGPADTATLHWPNGITASTTGDTLYVTEYFGDRVPSDQIRMITAVRAVADDSAPEADALDLGAFPNPVRDRATLTYRLPAPAQVLLSVYDSLGREVDRLGEGPRTAGTHAEAWATDGLAPGVYTVRLQADDRRISRPVVVVR